MQKDHLENETFKCNFCDGKGIIYTDTYEYCYYCNGIGKLNWIDNIFGTQRKNKSDIEYSLFIENGNKFANMSIEERKLYYRHLNSDEVKSYVRRQLQLC